MSQQKLINIANILSKFKEGFPLNSTVCGKCTLVGVETDDDPKIGTTIKVKVDKNSSNNTLDTTQNDTDVEWDIYYLFNEFGQNLVFMNLEIEDDNPRTVFSDNCCLFPSLGKCGQNQTWQDFDVNDYPLWLKGNWEEPQYGIKYFNDYNKPNNKKVMKNNNTTSKTEKHSDSTYTIEIVDTVVVDYSTTDSTLKLI